MVEQAHAGEGHDDAVLIALFDDQIVTDGAAGLSDVLDTGSDTALDRVSEGEESVTAQWEQFGKEVNIEEEFGESGGALFNFSLSGGSEKKSKKANRNASSLQSNPTTDDGVYTETVQPRNKPTIVIQPDEDETDAYRTNPTKTYNGKFKVRDEQGHSYECHFANVGQVVSDTISVCTKLY